MKNKNIEVKCFFGINRDNHNHESVLEITDSKTHKRIIDITFTPTQIVQLFGRMGGVVGLASVIDEENFKQLGKTAIRESLDVEIHNIKDEFKREMAVIKAKDLLKDSEYDWQVSDYFGSKESFFEKDGLNYAKVKITRYE